MSATKSNVENPKDYLKKHNLHNVFEDIAARVLRDRPSDPIAAIKKHVAQLESASSTNQSPHGTPRGDSQRRTPRGSQSGTMAGSRHSVDVSQKHEVATTGCTDMVVFDRMFSAFADGHPTYDKKFWGAFRELLAGFQDGYVPFKLPQEGETVVVSPEMAQGLQNPKSFLVAKTLTGINAFEIANHLDVSVDVAIEELLHAAGYGLMTMRWCIACAKCSTLTCRVTNMFELPENSRCKTCKASTSGKSMEHLVVMFFLPEAIFNNPNTGAKCSLPARIMQRSVGMDVTAPNDGTLVFKHSLKKGRYGAACPLSNLYLTLNILEDADESSEDFIVIELNMPEMLGEELPPMELKHGNFEFHVRNQSQQFSCILLAKDLDRSENNEEFNVAGTPEQPRYLTAMEVMHFPTFHKYFANQVLSLEQSITVERVVLVFTDITDSTKQYDAIGDGNALKMVKDHFEILFDAVDKHKGRMVKTIGDAIMCSFTDASAAVTAMMEAVGRCKRYSRSKGCPSGACVKLKIGMHAGHAMLVSLNGVNDYFGQTVNIAARVQGTATSNEIVIAESVWQDTGLQDTLARLGDEKKVKTTLEDRELTLKGVSGVVKAKSLRIENDGLDYNEEVFAPEIYEKPNTQLGGFLPKMFADIARGIAPPPPPPPPSD